MLQNRSFVLGGYLLAWLILAGGSGLIAYTSFSYYSLGSAHSFLLENEPFSEGIFFRISLYLHVIAGCVCLLSTLPQFIRPFLRRWPQVHRWSGKVYVFSILLVLCPTGFYLSLFAKGGLVGKGLFVLLGAATAYTTWRGFIAIIKGRRHEHVQWIARSFAFASSAITFRVCHVLFHYLSMEPSENYFLSLILSIFGNWFVVELLLYRAYHKRNVSSISSINQPNVTYHENLS
ncbi:DUF2306 domain-containing protein [Rubellicoccus peritrichatus]|uniref:DUF2306 domain-containing protein n=1 Tax=Rubellicoccus peritrichatus TaxID=3080537 RepID=A0AAQ3LA20_9BACT|nr:DUF2306 domain-containing protein [Puniceicoccus sp. CR14]WOO40704.1 DUF2306 domain-containing protein [Puniceicoccus sp. CR14]